MNFKKMLSTCLVSILALSCLVVSASASGYDDNTVYRNLNVPYSYAATHGQFNMDYQMKYWPRDSASRGYITSYTRVEVGQAAGAAGKAYTAMIKRDPIWQTDAGQIQNSSTKNVGGYVVTEAYPNGETKWQYANTVLHSGYNNSESNWRFDHRYIKN